MPLPDFIVLSPDGAEVPPPADARVVHVLAHWRTQVRDGRLPARVNIDPVALGRVLPNISILDVVGDGDFRFRLAGEALNQRYGALKNCRLSELMDVTLLRLNLEGTRTCVEQGVAVFTRDTERTSRRLGDRQIVQRLLMPLAVDGATVDALLCVMIFEGD